MNSRPHIAGRRRSVRKAILAPLPIVFALAAAPIAAAESVPTIFAVGAPQLATLAGTASATPVATPTAPVAPVAAKSPFALDRTSSKPRGLSPDTTATPFDYPDQPVVLSWASVTGAKTYKVEISNASTFVKPIWSGETDQVSIAPDQLLPDGEYFWRVTATDTGGTVGASSDAARVAKRWPSVISGLKTATSYGGVATNAVGIHPYFAWDALKGAKQYEVQVSAADQFANPSFSFVNWHTRFATPATKSVLSDDAYQWRVRALDAKDNPGPWSAPSAFTKVMPGTNLTNPDDGATVNTLLLSWEPVDGVSRYRVQISTSPYNWDGTPSIVYDKAEPGASLAPKSTVFTYGTRYYWRVRTELDSKHGVWSSVRSLTAQSPVTSNTTMQLEPVADVTDGLVPVVKWSPISGASVYRVDVASDRNFNTIVYSVPTTYQGATSLDPLPDNQVGAGYYWRVIWGSGGLTTPNWVVDESAVPVGSFKKQTTIVANALGDASVTEAPNLSWVSVPGISKYSVQLSQDQRFQTEVITQDTFGTSFNPNAYEGAKALADGTWFWRVRAKDNGNKDGETWSPTSTFTLQTPRPTLAEPADGLSVVDMPTFRWTPAPLACGYQVDLSQNSTFSDQTQSVKTAQTAVVPTNTQVNAVGKWYWRVRADLCDGNLSAWSTTRAFTKLNPPDFGLLPVPKLITFGTAVTIAGQLKFGTGAVVNPELTLRKREAGDPDFKPVGIVKGDGAGKYAFRITPQATGQYDLVWPATETRPGGRVEFSLRVAPKLAYTLGSTKVARKGSFKVSGTMSPARRIHVQVRTKGTDWRTITTIEPKGTRFTQRVKAAVDAGRYDVRLYSPGTDLLASAVGSKRKLFVFDKFVIAGAPKAKAAKP